MKNSITLRFTEEQHYFLTQLAKDEHRTPEELLWLLLEYGHSYYTESHSVDAAVPKQDSDFTEEEKESIKKWEAGDHSGDYVCKYHDVQKTREVLTSITDNIMNFRK